ncbi:bifunctional AP-4-A phosphorylase/ADP sulfurylase [Martiniozyma asiatica (nom. inval.)]|nr:bifunctional AP-4-A phosphorylase/ADP sulfurylase [Martiniozyma asiatica]
MSSPLTEIGSIEELRKFDLLGNITDLFDRAEKNGDLVYADSKFKEIIDDEETDLQYELKIIDALAVRPINRPTEPESDEKITNSHIEKVNKKNPFLRPEPELTIIDKLCNDYRLVLNKYPNSKYHFLLVTREFEPQNSLLKPNELMIIRTIVEILNKELKKQGNGEKYFAFFNSGPNSGYSQFHKHIQFMRLPNGFKVYQNNVIQNVDFFIPNELDQNKRPLFSNKCSFKHSILKLNKLNEDDEENEDILALLYMYLFNRVLNVYKEMDIDRSKLSYNFLLMDDWMMIVPRSKANYEGIWQNSLGFMGLFNAKDEAVKDKILELGFSKILSECGFPMEEDEEKIVYNGYGY